VSPPSRTDQGFALLAVMLVLALLGTVLAEFALSMRLEAASARSYKEAVLAEHLAEAAVQQAIREILSEAAIQALDDEGRLVFFRSQAGQALTERVPPLPRTRVPLGPGEFSYRISDEESRINVNQAPPERIDQLLLALGVERGDREVIVDALQDWKDGNDNFRANGAESEDYYLKLPIPYRARNGNLQDLAELLQIKGMTRALYWGSKDKPGLVEYLTVRGGSTVNINTAPGPVLKAQGLSDAEVSLIQSTRVRQPYPNVPPQFGGRSFGVGSSTFRIEAEGRIGEESRVRLVAIVQRGGGLGGGTGGPPPSSPGGIASPRGRAGTPRPNADTPGVGESGQARVPVQVLSMREIEAR
jgi:type II secretory pathway component PulK